MKKLIITFALTCSSTTFAADLGVLTCRFQSGADHGYVATFDNNGLSAKVTEITIAGEQPLAELKCFSRAAGGPHYPDQQFTIATCLEPDVADAGYSLDIKSGGISGLTMATLSQVSIAGSRVVANLICR